MGQTRYNFCTVFKKPSYIILSLIIAAIFYTFNVLITNREGIVGAKQFLSRRGMGPYVSSVIINHYQTVTVDTFVLLVLLALLFGTLFSLIIFKMRHVSGGSNQKKGGILASIGFVVGLLASSCVACGIGLFSLLGIGAATISFLPFGGIEVSLFAVLILLVSVWQYSRNLYVCKR